MIDIQTHILPRGDDGAPDLEPSLQLLKEAAADGTDEIIVTPHCAPAYGFFNFDRDELDRRLEMLRKAAWEREIRIPIHPGMEVLYEGRREMLYHAEDYFTLCGSRYLLMEYFFDAEPRDLMEGISTARECGYLPVIAHPERYGCIRKHTHLAAWARREGALFQINKGSLAGRHGKAALMSAVRLLERDEADFIASDAHHPVRRDSRLGGVYAYVRDTFGRRRAERLFAENPRRIIEDRDIQGTLGA